MRFLKLTRAANSTPGNPDSTKLRLYFVRGAAGSVPRHSGTRDSVPRAHLAGGVTATEQILGKKARDLLLFPERRPGGMKRGPAGARRGAAATRRGLAGGGIEHAGRLDSCYVGV